MTGTGIVKAFAFYMGAAGEPTSFDVEIAVKARPLSWSYVPGV